MYELNLERNSENVPPFDQNSIDFQCLKKITGDFFQMDNQPTIGTNVTGNHNIRQQHDQL